MRLPPREKRKGHEAYPIPDRQHAKSALGFAKMHHPNDSSLLARVRAKVRRKFPDMVKRHGGKVEGRPLRHRLDRRHRGGIKGE